MGQHQNLELIREETMIESIMAGMESGEYFSQLQLQSPQLSQASFSMQSPSQQQQQQQHSGQLTTPMLTPSSMNGQFDYSPATSTLAVSTPLLASQTQTVFDMSAGAGAGVGVTSAMGTTPTVPSSTLLPSSMDGATSYNGYPAFSSTANPLFSSPPAISSSATFSPSGTFSPTMSNMPSYFTSQPQQPNHQQQQFFPNGTLLSPGTALKSSSQATNDTPIVQDGGDSMFMASTPGVSVWDTYSMTNPTPSMEVLIQQQQHQQFQLSGDLSSQVHQVYQQQQQQDQLQGPPLNSVGGIN
ncbi:hypothetical protein BGZ65_010187, partial [Modicella reniformis]